jgi:predicted nucleotidyltransferase
MVSKITQEIQARLDKIATDEKSTILLAIESGSRAWGFESQDSDYDVRFIYVRKLDDYLRIRPMRDVIELPIMDDLDINGWDLQKALGLLIKSNPPALEWLSSPIVYRRHPAAERLQQAAEKFFDPVSTSHHYLSMALKTQKHLRTNQVIRKKYFYALRPLFCLDWIREQRTMPPMEFSKLLSFALRENDDPELGYSIQNLLRHKKAGKEIEKGPRDNLLDAFISKKMSYYQAVDFGKPRPLDYDLADEIFREIIHAL